MSVTVKWNGDDFKKAARLGVAHGLNAVAISFQREVAKQLSKQGSTKKSGRRPSSPGQPPALQRGHLVRSWQAKTDGGYGLTDAQNIFNPTRPRVEVGSNVVYAKIHEFGGTITPKSKKFLVVPMHIDAWGRNPSSFKDTYVKQFGGGRLGIFRKNVTKTGRRRTRGGQALADDLLYLLVKKVTLPKRPYVRPALEVMRPKAAGIAMHHVNKAIAKFK